MQWIFHWSQVHSRERNASHPSGQIKKPIPRLAPDPYPCRNSISELWYQICVLWTCKTVYDDINFLMTHLLNHPGPSESHLRSGYLEHSDDALHRQDEDTTRPGAGNIRPVWHKYEMKSFLWAYLMLKICPVILPWQVTFDEQTQQNTGP